MKVPHWMLDLETLGTTPDSVVVSFAAFAFDPHESPADIVGRALAPASTTRDGLAFQARLQLAEQFEGGRRAELGTCKWWLRRVEPAVAARELFESPRWPVGEALERLAAFINRTWDDKRSKIWSRGTDFDLPLLSNLSGQFAPAGLRFPWHFADARDQRTAAAESRHRLEHLRRHADLERIDYLRKRLRLALPDHGAANDAAAQAYELACLNHELHPPVEQELRLINERGEPICASCGTPTNASYAQHRQLKCWSCGADFPDLPTDPNDSHASPDSVHQIKKAAASAKA